MVGLADAAGGFVAQYTYDAWGNLLSSSGSMAAINPLRYRGYYYDTETGFYYLQSRYYDPANHRFINADVYASTDSTDAISCNMFAYCGNNPVIASDESGEFWHIVVGAIVGVVSQYVSDVVSNVLEGKTGVDILRPTSSIADYAASAASGALAATGIGLAGSVAANTAISSVAYLANTISEGDEPTLAGLAIAAGTGMVSGFIGGSGVDGNKIKGVWNTSKDVLSTAVSPKKIAMYTAKIAMCRKTIVVGTLRTVASIAASNAAGKVAYSE